MDQKYNLQKYTIRKKIFKFLGASFHIYDQEGNLVFYVHQKGFKLKKDIKVYADESMQTQFLSIKARKVIDFSGVYDVVDTINNQVVGSLKRKGWKSMLKDEWVILGQNDQEVGLIKEDSNALAFIRRFLTNLIPQEFHAYMGEKIVWHFKQHFNPFVVKIDVDTSHDTEDLMDNRLAVGAAVLLSAIEGRQ